MNIQDLGAIGELVAAIATVATLAYLAVQIRQNTKTVTASTELETGKMWTEFLARTAHNPDMADIWDKGHSDQEALTPNEKRKFIWQISEYFSIVENHFRQRDLNFLSHETWLQHGAAVAGMLANPLIARWWVNGVTPFSESFRTAIEEIQMEQGDQAGWTYTPLSEL